MLFSFIVAAGLLSAGKPYVSGTHVPDSIQAVTVTADKGVVVSRTDTLSLRNSFTVSDILHQSPGLYVGDYGGVAGLKTVSLRGMGSPHTSIYIDGVKVGNVQSGQTDLGMMGIAHYGAAIVDYAQNSLSFNTLRPVFRDRGVAGNVRLAYGSFGTLLPSARMDFRLSDRVALSANAEGVVSKGNFKYGDGQERVNNDIRQVRGGIDLFGLMSSGDWHVKAYVNSAERGTPGSVTWPSEDRQKDINAFVQGVLRNRFSPLYSLQVSAKASYDDIYYTSSWGDSRYGQTEVQLNSSHVFDVCDWWKMSFAADLQWDGLKSTVYDASRLTVNGAVTAAFRLDRLSADIGLEYGGFFDVDALSRNVLSPSVDFRFMLLEGLDIVAFGRRAYRVPTFNELYYVGYGNPDLKPENAWLTDVGLDFVRTLTSSWKVNAKIDGFFNFLTDKITSAPTAEDPNIWLPYNIGKVRSTGLDAVVGFVYESGGWECSFDARYSFQSSIDVTPDSYSFGERIPYVSKHSVVLDASVAWKGFELNPRWILRSGRYDSAGELPDWNTLDITLSKNFVLPATSDLTVFVSGRNIFDCRYELITGYPMPGRNILAGLTYSF
ncbi:MAG: TonB-dependent receptor [Bacteroidales bacterium]|nr:TonB-dependent receptor [Bacteroidales bacterium]